MSYRESSEMSGYSVPVLNPYRLRSPEYSTFSNKVSITFPVHDGLSRYNGTMAVLGGDLYVIVRAQGNPYPTQPDLFSSSKIELWKINELGGLEYKCDISDQAEDPTVSTRYDRHVGQSLPELGFVDVNGIKFEGGDNYSNFRTRFFGLNRDITLGTFIEEGRESQKDQRIVELPNHKRLVLFRRRDHIQGQPVDSAVYWYILDEGKNISNDLEKRITKDDSHVLFKFEKGTWGGPNQLALVRGPDNKIYALMLVHFAFETGKIIDGHPERQYFSGITLVGGIEEEQPRLMEEMISILPLHDEINVNQPGQNIPRHSTLSDVVFGSGFCFVKREDGKWDIAVIAGVGDSSSAVFRLPMESMRDMHSYHPLENAPGAGVNVLTGEMAERFERFFKLQKDQHSQAEHRRISG